MLYNARINYRLSILAFLLGLFITGSALLTPTTSLLAADGSPETPITAPDQLAGGQCVPDYG